MVPGPVMQIESSSAAQPLVPFTERKASHLFRQLLLAVEFLHANHIIHRDIKPANLLLYDANTIKLSDFGDSTMFEMGKVSLTP